MSFQIDKNAIEKLAKAKLAEEAKSWNKELEQRARKTRTANEWKATKRDQAEATSIDEQTRSKAGTCSN